MACKPRIRSELIADKEKNPKEFTEALRERWGFYRPVSKESADEISAVLDIAVPSIKTYLDRKRRQVADIEMQDAFGVAFVKRSTVGRKMFKAIAGGFRMAYAVEDLGRLSKCVKQPLKVPLDWEKFDWYAKSGRKAAAIFAESEELDRLYEEEEVIEDTLEEHGLIGVTSEPDHITLFRYGRPNDNLGLTPHYKKGALRIIKHAFDDAGLDSVLLDPLNVGPDYTEPCGPWAKACIKD